MALACGDAAAGRRRVGDRHRRRVGGPRHLDGSAQRAARRRRRDRQARAVRRSGCARGPFVRRIGVRQMMPHVHDVGGHTLIELVIALALGLVVTAGAVSLYTTQRAAFDRANNALRMRDAGLTALTVVGQQLQMAGFVPADATQYRAPTSLFGCSGGHPTGTDDSRPTCETLTGKSDGVAVLYVGDSVSTWPSATGQTT